MTESLNQSQKQSSQGQSSHSAQHSVRNMVLNFHHGEKKKILQWKSKRNEYDFLIINVLAIIYLTLTDSHILLEFAIVYENYDVLYCSLTEVDN